MSNKPFKFDIAQLTLLPQWLLQAHAEYEQLFAELYIYTGFHMQKVIECAADDWTYTQRSTNWDERRRIAEEALYYAQRGVDPEDIVKWVEMIMWWKLGLMPGRPSIVFVKPDKPLLDPPPSANYPYP